MSGSHRFHGRQQRQREEILHLADVEPERASALAREHILEFPDDLVVTRVLDSWSGGQSPSSS